MALIDEVKTVCDRLAPLGWRELLKAATGGSLDIVQASSAALKAALTAAIPHIDRSLPGLEDFDAAGTRGITASNPSQSLLYHALASPRVVRGADGTLLGGFPMPAEIEAVENLVFGVTPPTLEAIRHTSGAAELV